MIIQRYEALLREGKCVEEIDRYTDCLKQAGFVNVGLFRQIIPLQRDFGKSNVLVGLCMYGFSPMACQLYSNDNYATRCLAVIIDMFKQWPPIAKTLSLSPVQDFIDRFIS